MLIRNMTEEDYDCVYDIWVSTPGMGLNNVDDSKEGITKYLKRNPTTCFVAETEDNRIVGVIICGHDGRRGYIYHMAVNFEYRQNGLGRKLVQKALQALEEEGICKVALLVKARNEMGNAFWDRIGFTDRTDIVYRNKNIKDLVRLDI